jgi:hypothetical protein
MDDLDILFQRININPNSDDIDNLISKVEKLKINNGQIKTNDKMMKNLISSMGGLNLVTDDKKKSYIKKKLRSYQKKRFRTGYKKQQPTKQEIDDIFDIMFRLKEENKKDEDEDIIMGGSSRRALTKGLRHIQMKKNKKPTKKPNKKPTKKPNKKRGKK